MVLEEITSRRPYNAASDFVDANVARGLGEKVAFIDPERSLTYSELQACTCGFAAALRRLGLQPEERLLLLAYDTVDFPVVFFGAIRSTDSSDPQDELNTLLSSDGGASWVLQPGNVVPDGGQAYHGCEA